MATEICFIKLKQEINIEEGEAAKAWEEGRKIISTTKGSIDSSWGLQYENPKILVWFISWESVDDHIRFTESEAYRPFKEIMEKFMEDAYFYHILPVSLPHSILNTAPCTEIAVFCEISSNYSDKIKEFGDALANSKFPGFYGYSYGLTHEKVSKAFDDDAEKKEGALLLIGWESRERHSEFRETELFKEKVPLLREGKAVEMFHVSFRSN
ncbi:hypothetical protein F5884DRAFT_160085 [Xylogone sp. PMI_703]|nr:hypothetical protein F5884DRAFT_160085 [Xylogone sp. PMI_703]